QFSCLSCLLQKLKRSLSFKTKSLRSKSADNFFQRTCSDMKLQTDLLPDVSGSTGQLTGSISQNSTPSKSQKQVDIKTHSFVEHTFKKPTFCDICNHMIVGVNAKHGLRCKACKMSIHHKCAEGVGPQRCMGKLPKGFRRYYSSPLLIQEQYGCIKEVMPIACGSKVDPVYEALRFGTSLAQKTKRSSTGSGSESPQRNSTSDLAEVPEEIDSHSHSCDSSRNRSDSGGHLSPHPNMNYFYYTYCANLLQAGSVLSPFPHKDVLQLNTYVALYQFLPQESRDLERCPGQVVAGLLSKQSVSIFSAQGAVHNRTGFFPANFAEQVKAGGRVFRCMRTFIGCKEQGQITLKEGQVCVTHEEEKNGFIMVSSGKKKGFIPCDILENI
uniref:SH3 and cysteine rich domain n=1 Tax=Erpetoichthys calabaricus TaxID=27687 RepID=A0A8C4TAQ6_ERPCA